MTKDQRVELCDTLTAARAAMERAQVLINTLLDGYFNKFTSGRDDFAILYEFKRQGVFADLLRDQLIAIESELSAAEWVESLEGEVLS